MQKEKETIHDMRLELRKEIDPSSYECLERLGYIVLTDGRVFCDHTYMGRRARYFLNKLREPCTRS